LNYDYRDSVLADKTLKPHKRGARKFCKMETANAKTPQPFSRRRAVWSAGDRATMLHVGARKQGSRAVDFDARAAGCRGRGSAGNSGRKKTGHVHDGTRFVGHAGFPPAVYD
jgi:hypothetical protein